MTYSYMYNFIHFIRIRLFRSVFNTCKTISYQCSDNHNDVFANIFGRMVVGVPRKPIAFSGPYTDSRNVIGNYIEV